MDTSFCMCAFGFNAPFLWFLTATAASCSSVVAYSCMWAVAINAKRPGKVIPFHGSNGESEAVARMPVTSGIGWFVIFSTPPTRTLSQWFDLLAIIAPRRAEPEDAHALC